MSKFAYFHHSSSLQHDTGPYHPERVDRIVALERELQQRGWCGFEPVVATPATREMVELAHSLEHFERVSEAVSSGEALDPDTVVSSGSLDAALHSAGAAVEMVDGLLDGELTAGFCDLRPPGHHAERERAMGFCLFNNVAIAAQRALAQGAGRVAIVDWDVHHGNGTEEIFYASDRVFYSSLHQYPFYPGTGAASDRGVGAGVGCTLNVPMSAGTGDSEWVGALESSVLPAVSDFGPDLLLVSAGYDAHRDDPLGSCDLTEAGFAAMTALLVGLAGRLDIPIGFVLEGGYDLGALANSVAATLETVVSASE